MKRLVGTAVGLGVIAFLLCIPAFFYGSRRRSSRRHEETTITNYVADFDVAENGDIDVVETITVDFPVYGKHGIFRFWDIVDANAPHARRIPEDISVTLRRRARARRDAAARTTAATAWPRSATPTRRSTPASTPT